MATVTQPQFDAVPQTFSGGATSFNAPQVASASMQTVHISFWQKVTAVEHTFIGWWGKELTKFQKDEPKIVQGLDALTTYAIPALNIAVAAAGGPSAIGSTAAKVIADAQSGLAVASSLAGDFGPSPTVAGVYTGIQNNLQSILTLDGVKNPQTVDAITKVVNSIGAAAAGIQAAIVTPAPAESSTNPTA